MSHSRYRRRMFKYGRISQRYDYRFLFGLSAQRVAGRRTKTSSFILDVFLETINDADKKRDETGGRERKRGIERRRHARSNETMDEECGSVRKGFYIDSDQSGLSLVFGHRLLSEFGRTRLCGRTGEWE